MKKNFKSVISVLLALLLVITSAVCGVAVDDAADGWHAGVDIAPEGGRPEHRAYGDTSQARGHGRANAAVFGPSDGGR